MFTLQIEKNYKIVIKFDTFKIFLWLTLMQLTNKINELSIKDLLECFKSLKIISIEVKGLKNLT